MASAKTRRRLANEPWRKLYGTKRWKDTRRHALIRAGRMCELCGSDRSLDVHHIIALKDGGSAFDAGNLLVLCRPCHRTADKADPRFFREGQSTSRPVDISPPETGKTAEEPAEEPEKPHEYWLSPEGLRWSRDWGGGTHIVDGEPVVPS